MGAESSRIRKRGVALATVGLLFALGVLLVMRIAGFSEFSTIRWLGALAVTLVVQGIMWLLPHLGIDRLLTWDYHFLYTPLAAAGVLLCVYLYIAPELRLIGLLSWTIAIMFMAGLAGFFGVLGVGLLMTVGYLFVVMLLGSQGRAPGPLRFDLMVAFLFVMINIYGGVVFERLKRDRREMKALRERLSEMALTDPLTELPNRRHFHERVSAEIGRVQRHGGGFTIAIIDIDDFKIFNDERGHLAGDHLLKEVATVIRTQMRVSDMLARFGGDEFVMLMPNTTCDEAVRGLDRIRKVVEASGFSGAEIQPEGRVTISAGAACCPQDGTEHDLIVKKADDSLYRAKRSGKNRIERA